MKLSISWFCSVSVVSVTALLAACSGSPASGGDGGDVVTNADTSVGLDGTGGDTGTVSDTGGSNDTGTANDTGIPSDVVVTDTGSPSDAAGSCSGVECTGFPATTFIRGCTNDVSCVGELHQVDCCGAIRLMGMNHSEATAFCTAEYGAAGCRPMYSTTPGCSSRTITTDTGETTTDMTRVATHCADIGSSGVGTCTTFVCGNPGGTPCPTSREIGTCG